MPFILRNESEQYARFGTRIPEIVPDFVPLMFAPVDPPHVIVGVPPRTYRWLQARSIVVNGDELARMGLLGGPRWS
jgi:hypothetical protein